MKVENMSLYKKVLSTREGTCYLKMTVIGNPRTLKELQTLIINFVNNQDIQE
jgi:hypothetical protein